MIPAELATIMAMGPDNAITHYGIYAIRTITGKEILAANCHIMKWSRTHNGVWYIPNNRENIVHVTERPIFVHGDCIESIAFNTKEKSDEEKSLDDLPY